MIKSILSACAICKFWWVSSIREMIFWALQNILSSKFLVWLVEYSTSEISSPLLPTCEMLHNSRGYCEMNGNLDLCVFLGFKFGEMKIAIIKSSYQNRCISS